jgi:hypothetical protein
MRYRLAALVAVAGIATGAALAVATPVTPQPGAVVTTSHPLSTWTLPSNEQSSAIYIANNPAVTPEGRFYDENVATRMSSSTTSANGPRPRRSTRAPTGGWFGRTTATPSSATTARRLPSLSVHSSRCCRSGRALTCLSTGST